ncbi:MAG: [Fe-Fe] hydrogenase large subunit C-terminal domain-containing protein [Candidatus ainarchaeum sp.]|nr:[Fe-Fe] hydrogenase large subunit C-terminal domain-containing protein [Candidatus ainarchaeum sp.]
MSNQIKSNIKVDNKNYSSSQIKVLDLLKNEKELCLMVAPSFVIDFNYKTFVPLMKGLGFAYVSELTFGAKIVNKNYHDYILENKNKQDFFISSACPTCVNLIKAQFQNLTKYLMPFDSPVITMAKILKTNFPNSKIVFLSPCLSKKIECKNSGLIEETITFKEMKDLIEKEKVIPKNCSHLFDRFYNDYTKIYPTSGGLSKTMKSKNILTENEIVICDGCKNLKEILTNLENNKEKKFYDILFCNGGCIGGPEINNNTPIWFRKFSLTSYIKNSKKEKIGNRKGLEEYTKNIDFKKKFN